jgi:hypothetical protein
MMIDQIPKKTEKPNILLSEAIPAKTLDRTDKIIQVINTCIKTSGNDINTFYINSKWRRVPGAISESQSQNFPSLKPQMTSTSSGKLSSNLFRCAIIIALTNSFVTLSWVSGA